MSYFGNKNPIIKLEWIWALLWHLVNTILISNMSSLMFHLLLQLMRLRLPRQLRSNSDLPRIASKRPGIRGQT